MRTDSRYDGVWRDSNRFGRSDLSVQCGDIIIDCSEELSILCVDPLVLLLLLLSALCS